MKFLLVGLFLIISTCYGVPIAELQEDNAKKYLHKYGYTASYSKKTPIEVEAIKSFQAFAHLEVTGKIDRQTIEKMEEPRCGMRDPIISVNKSGRFRRYNHQGTDWYLLFNKQNKMELRWTLINSGRSLRYNTVLKVMRQAIHYWHQKTNIDFVEIPKDKVGQKGYEKENIEILVSFESGYHSDPYPFDGPGRTLAHAFYPHTNQGFSGDVHFDDDEYYTYKSSRGRNLLWVATHELGHSLGLEHSQVREAVMFPFYTKYKPGFKLNEDDILGIQSLYGSRSKPDPVDPSNPIPTTTTPAPTLPPPSKGLCPSESRNGKITAVYYSQQYRQIFAFTTKHKIFFLGYQKRIPVLNRFNYYPNVAVPGTIDAVFTYDQIENNGVKYQIIFTGEKYHVYKGFSRRNGFHSIHNGNGPLKLNFPTYVKKIDAAFTWPTNGRTYFFSGTQYWRYDNKKKQFDKNYPKSIYNNWNGLPSRIDAAYSSPDKRTTFFIADGKYYLYDDRNIRVRAVYPLSRFLECENAAAIKVVQSNHSVAGKIGAIGSISDEKPMHP